MRSLRRTLAVRFSITMLVALLVIAVWAYAGATAVIRDQLDRSLASAMGLEAAVLAAGHPIPANTDAPGPERNATTVHRLVAVRDARGKVVGGNTSSAAHLPLDSAAFAAARAGTPVARTQRWGDHAIRALYAPAPRGSPPGYAVLQVAATLDAVRAAQRDVAVLMLGTVILGSLATMFGARWLAGSAINPVREITEQAEAVEAGVPGQRITAHAHVAEFEGLLRVLNGMLERLDRALLAERRLASDVGHDLRTPLTAIRGEIEVALRGARSPAQYGAALRSVLEEVDHLQGISEALVLLHRLEGGENRPERVPVDLTELAGCAVERVRHRGPGRTYRCRQAGAGDGLVQGDLRMLSVALDHLLDNTVRHTPPDTEVVVTVSGGDGKVSLSVADNGPGVPTEALPHLFQRFYRGDEARSRTAGAGLGLSVAAAVVRAHGGEISAQNSPGGGLEVVLTLAR